VKTKRAGYVMKNRGNKWRTKGYCATPAAVKALIERPKTSLKMYTPNKKTNGDSAPSAPDAMPPSTTLDSFAAKFSGTYLTDTLLTQ